MPFPDTPVGTCKAGVAQASLGSDVIACDDGSTLVALSAQNYGVISQRSLAPFDFAGRTGTISFDSDAVTTGSLGSWISVFVTDKPVPVAAKADEVMGYLPTNGFGVTFASNCGGGKVGVSAVTTYTNTAETYLQGNGACVPTNPGTLLPFTIGVSGGHLTVKQGSTTLFDRDVQLSLDRGYVHFQTAERAPAKYGLTPPYAESYWANMTFDGPSLDVPNVARVPDNGSVVPRGRNVGYSVPATLTAPGVPDGINAATLAGTIQFSFGGQNGTPTLSYSLNGHAAHPVPFDYEAETTCAGCPGPKGGNGIGFALPVDTSELVAGNNTIRFTATGQTGSWPVIVANVSLLTGGGASTPTTTSPPPTTSVTTSSTTSTSTTTSTPAATTTSPSTSGPGCGLDAPAFCDTFDSPAAPHTLNARTGDLDPVLWGVSRVGQNNDGNGQLWRVASPTMSHCGVTGQVRPPLDVQICGGQLFEAVNDDHGVANLDMYPKQPFNFAGRTGTISFDVGDDSEGSHGAWPELIVTDKPVPGTRDDISNAGGTGAPDVVPPAALNEFGVIFDGGCIAQQDTTGVGNMIVSRNGAFTEIPFTQVACVKKGDATHLNRFQVKMSASHVDVYGSDPGGPLKLIATADGLNLTFTQGLVWINDTHYNADKFPNPIGQRDHTFVWDNLGFDGPKTYRDLGYDVPDANAVVDTERTNIGYHPGTFTIPNVDIGQATGAQVVFSYFTHDAVVPSLSVNGNPTIVTPVPFNGETAPSPHGWTTRTISVPVPLSQVHQGSNTIAFSSPDGSTELANISLILVAGAPVP